MGMKIKEWLQSLSFRTGVIVLMCCIPFYILSFAQMLLPISTTAKGVLWAVLFGLNEAADEMEIFAKQEGHHGATLRAMIEKYKK